MPIKNAAERNRAAVTKAVAALAEILLECQPDALIDDEERVTNIERIAREAMYGTDGLRRTRPQGGKDHG